MADGKVSRVIVAMTALLVSASAVPMTPFSKGPIGMYGGFGHQGGHNMGMGNGMGMGMNPWNLLNPMVGQSFSSGSSFGSSNNGQNIVSAMEPTKLAAVTRRIDVASGRVDGMLGLISEQQNLMRGPLNVPGQGMGGFNFGYGGYGHFGQGLMGGRGGLGSHGGMHKPGGMGRGGPGNGLELQLQVNVGILAAPLEALLVFTSAANPDLCTAESLGSVLTRPSGRQGNGFATGHMMTMQPFAATPSDLSSFGVISTLTIQSGVNNFQIRGLGNFENLGQLAGRGIALCEDVVIGVNGPMCAGDTFQVLFCGRLGFVVQDPILAP